MKVQVDVYEVKEREDQKGNLDTERIRICSEIENWDICKTPSAVYRAAVKEYGRCASKMFVERKDGTARHIGWVFVKRVKYTDCNETYLQETWICPLAKHEVKTVVEYAL